MLTAVTGVLGVLATLLSGVSLSRRRRLLSLLATEVEVLSKLPHGPARDDLAAAVAGSASRYRRVVQEVHPLRRALPAVGVVMMGVGLIGSLIRSGEGLDDIGYWAFVAGGSVGGMAAAYAGVFTPGLEQLGGAVRSVRRRSR